MPGKRDTWNKPIPRQNIVIVRRADRAPMSRRQRAELAEINAEEPIDPNERNLWINERKLVLGVGQDSSATKVQGGRRRSTKRKTRRKH
jgi:hypothetical protein